MSDHFDGVDRLQAQRTNTSLMQQNIALLGLVSAKQEGLNIANSFPKSNRAQPESENVQFGKWRIEQLEIENEVAQRALKEANDLVKDWQSAMEAWRDLAQTLRNEIKACPNHEAHKFGQDDKARANRANSFEDKKRLEFGLPAKYTPEQKGL